jgi:L-fuculose-phosphate aldolase
MDDERERGELLAAGLVLAEKRLVARTWGNLSLRLDAGRFLITPSGIPYEDLSPGDMVVVGMEDLSWSGPLKPSSERGLHAMVYRLRPAVGAIAHTHQSWASAVAAARTGIPAPSGGGKASPCARYALPTTKALVRAVERTLKGVDADAVLLANHGALCMGAGMAEAIREAEGLEDRARAFVLGKFGEKGGFSAKGLPSEEDLALAFAAARGRLRA